jgi:hypothetical protein
MTEKKKAPAKKEEVAVKETVVKKEEAPKKAAASGKDPSGERKIVKIFPSESKAMVSVGEKTFKVTYHRERKTGEWMLAVDGGKSVYEKDWIEGKADVGLLV